MVDLLKRKLVWAGLRYFIVPTLCRDCVAQRVLKFFMAAIKYIVDNCLWRKYAVRPLQQSVLVPLIKLVIIIQEQVRHAHHHAAYLRYRRAMLNKEPNV